MESLELHQGPIGANSARISEAIWQIVDAPPAEIVRHVQIEVPGAAIEDIAAEYCDAVKIGLPPTEVDELDAILPAMADEPRMALWRAIGRLAGAL